MTHGAYLVGAIDRHTLQLIAVDVFSEERPTMPLWLYPVTLEYTKSDDSYDEARSRLMVILELNHWDWLRPLLNKSRAWGEPWK